MSNDNYIAKMPGSVYHDQITNAPTGYQGLTAAIREKENPPQPSLFDRFRDIKKASPVPRVTPMQKERLDQIADEWSVGSCHHEQRFFGVKDIGGSDTVKNHADDFFFIIDSLAEFRPAEKIDGKEYLSIHRGKHRHQAKAAEPKRRESVMDYLLKQAKPEPVSMVTRNPHPALPARSDVEIQYSIDASFERHLLQKASKNLFSSTVDSAGDDLLSDLGHVHLTSYMRRVFKNTEFVTQPAIWKEIPYPPFPAIPDGPGLVMQGPMPTTDDSKPVRFGIEDDNYRSVLGYLGPWMDLNKPK